MAPRPPRIFYGWWIVTISMAVNAIVSGGFFWGISVFFLPISRDLNITRAAASLPVSISRFIGIFQGPIVGALVDRLGPAKVLFAAAFLGGLGYILISFTHSYLMYLLVFVGVLGLGMQSGFDAPTMATVNQWFIRNRTLAMTLSAMGFALGGAIFTPLLALAVDAWGWRDTTLIVGILIWAVVLPLATRLYRSPESRGLLPDGDPAPPPIQTLGRSQRPGDTTDFTLREALLTRAYWQLALSLGLRSIVWGGLLVHMVAVMNWKGLDESTAGILVGLMAFIGMPAAMFMGWLGDRYTKTRLVSIGDLFTTSALCSLILLDNISVWQMVLIAILWSPNQGNWPLTWSILGEQFGRRNFGVLRGGIVATMSFFSFGAPLYAGWVFDTTESYFWVLAPAIAFLLASSFCTWTLPRAVRPSTRPPI